MDTEALLAESLGDNFYRFDYDLNRILNVKTGKLMPRVRPCSIPVPPDELPPNRNPIADGICAQQMNGEIPIFRLAEIIKSVCVVREVAVSKLLSGVRTRKVATARQMVFYLARNHTSLSLPCIARHLNRECHSTVVHGWKQISKNMETHAGTIAKIMALLKEE